MKKIVLSFISVAALLGTANAQILNLNQGWNNVGVVDAFNIENITNSSLRYVWKYSNNAWKIYSPDTSVQNVIAYNISHGLASYSQMSGRIESGSALWIYSDTNTTLRIGEAAILASIEGLIKNASNYGLLSGVTLALKNSAGDIVAQRTTLSDGSFNFADISGGVYTLSVTKDGFYSNNINVDISSSGVVSLEQIYLVPEATVTTANISGGVIDSATSSVLTGAVISVREGFNNTSTTPLRTVTVGESGYTLSTLPQGNYTFTIVKDGYYTTNENVTIYSDNTSTITRNFSMNALLNDNAIARIKLDWGAYPYDLDSHLLAQVPTETYTKHLFYSTDWIYYDQQDSNGNSVKIAELDRDDTDSYGPETITIYNTPNVLSNEYSYYVYNYSGDYSGKLQDSQAKVTANYQNQTYTFNVPQGEGRYWKVFTIIDGNFLPCTNECIVNDISTSLRTFSKSNPSIIKAETEANKNKF